MSEQPTDDRALMTRALMTGRSNAPWSRNWNGRRMWMPPASRSRCATAPCT